MLIPDKKRYLINYLSFCLRKKETEKQIKCKTSGRKKLTVEINKIEKHNNREYQGNQNVVL